MKLINYYRYYRKEKNFKRERNIYKISIKLKKLRTNFDDKTKFIIKTSKSELINSENNGTEESETSDDEYLSNFTKLQPYIYEPCFKRVCEIKLSRVKIIRFRRRH